MKIKAYMLDYKKHSDNNYKKCPCWAHPIDHEGRSYKIKYRISKINRHSLRLYELINM
jgi:hypothetical protein